MSVKRFEEFVIEDIEKEFEKELEPILQNVVSAIQSKAPVRTGNLKKSIMYKFEKGKATIYTQGMGASLLHLVERGTVARKKKNGGVTGSMPARPFFYPTISSFEKEIDEKIKELVKGAVK